MSEQLPHSVWETSVDVAMSLIKFSIIAFLIVTPFRFFVAQPFIVSGASMAPTLEKGEYLVIDELTYRFEAPERGDVVIFHYPLDPALFFVKRIIGLPGESIEIKDGVVFVHKPDGTQVQLHEPYLSETVQPGNAKAIHLASDEYFVLGDNRSASADSRQWGPLQERYIIGRALMQLFPLSEARMLPGKYSFDGM